MITQNMNWSNTLIYRGQRYIYMVIKVEKSETRLKIENETSVIGVVYFPLLYETPPGDL